MRSYQSSQRVLTNRVTKSVVRATRVVKAHASTDAYNSIKGLNVYRATDGSEVELVKQWEADERVLVAWTRSLGCPFCQELATQLQRDVKPKLDEIGVKLLMVSIGTPERSKDFVARTGFPASNLYLDPENITYDALQLKNTVQDTFFNVATPLSIAKRFAEGKSGDLMDILDGWQPWMTPKGPTQALQQGGMYVFQGQRMVFSYQDKATGDHADIEQIMAVARSMPPQRPDCGCENVDETEVAR
ncbi:hypothetical protein CEUSTIGMA_g331.t1 [Chlamydomonas eustigma]|uniref:Thioredoxin domain-containing protein n=1 Tax=Chlamydomonas eustigma TaxID=1157962 RepID=A0A250WQ94_9CHLO|nr:hypothetical protein CEUSTIGMA_g331.t1 [Chlamydomonas eustigma]|eukprot:GAX72876.1 hypothetical protein CEUSTIGMA_g331.t1 [Chlamydomonas eustigma]